MRKSGEESGAKTALNPITIYRMRSDLFRYNSGYPNALKPADR